MAEFKPQLEAWRKKNSAKLERAWERSVALETEVQLALQAAAGSEGDGAGAFFGGDNIIVESSDDDDAKSGDDDDGAGKLRSVIDSLDLSSPSGPSQGRSR